jgi:hypothetical protein
MADEEVQVVTWWEIRKRAKPSCVVERLVTESVLSASLLIELFHSSSSDASERTTVAQVAFEQIVHRPQVAT